MHSICALLSDMAINIDTVHITDAVLSELYEIPVGTPLFSQLKRHIATMDRTDSSCCHRALMVAYESGNEEYPLHLGIVNIGIADVLSHLIISPKSYVCVVGGTMKSMIWQINEGDTVALVRLQNIVPTNGTLQCIPIDAGETQSSPKKALELLQILEEQRPDCRSEHPVVRNLLTGRATLNTVDAQVLYQELGKLVYKNTYSPFIGFSLKNE